MWIIEKIYNVSVLFAILPGLFAIYKWKYFNLSLIFIGLQAIRGMVMGPLSLYLSSQNLNNSFLYFLSPCLDIILVSLMAYSILGFPKPVKYFISAICILFIVCMTLNNFFGMSLFKPYLSTFESIFVIILLGLMLRHVLINYKTGNYKKVLVWLIMAMFIGNLFSVLLSSFSGAIQSYSNELQQALWFSISPLIIIITSIMKMLGFSLLQKKVKGNQLVSDSFKEIIAT